MNAKEKIEELLEASEDGTITAAQVTEAGLHRSVLQEFVKSGEMYRFGRGLYVRSSAWEDDFYLLQRKYGRGIYSHDTALYLLGYSDRTPAKYTMTFPKGYNAPSLKQAVAIHLLQENFHHFHCSILFLNRRGMVFSDRFDVWMFDGTIGNAEI